MSASAANRRRSDLDWIRVCAFGLLILYHVGLVFAPWDWHIHSAHTFDWLKPLSLVTSPWRLTLLFLVSGAAVRLMSRKLTAGQVLRARLDRLIPPFLFGVLILVPPQSFIEAVTKHSWNSDLISWWLSEFSPKGLADGVPLNHLWFVLYIAVYSLVAVVLLTRPRWLDRAEAVLEKALGGWRLLVLPVVYLAVMRQWLFPWYGITNHLPADWYNHAMSLGAFLFGFMAVDRAAIWTTLERWRWRSAALAVIALPLLMALEVHPGGMAFNGAVQNSMYAIDQWVTIAAVLGFASRHLRDADSPALRYLTQAIFPCYLAHQTILVIAAWLILPLGLPDAAEALLLVAITLGGSLLAYEGVRRVNWLRPIWGLKRLRAAAPAAPLREAEVVALRPEPAASAAPAPIAAAPAYRPARERRIQSAR